MCVVLFFWQQRVSVPCQWSLQKSGAMSQNKLLPHWYLCTCVPPHSHSGSPCDCPIQTRGGNVQETIFTGNSKQRAKCAVLDLQCLEFIHLTKLCWITGWKIKSLKIMGPFNLTRAKKKMEIMRFGVFVNEGHHAQHAVSSGLCLPCFFSSLSLRHWDRASSCDFLVTAN